MMLRFLCLLLCLTSFALSETITGYLVDNFCWEMEDHIAIDGANLETNPGEHSVHCLKDIKSCVDSGYAIIVNEGTTANPSYERKYKLDSAGNTRALNLLRTTTAMNEYMVTATGSVSGSNPPTLNVDTLMETTPSGKVKHTGYMVDNFCWEMSGHIAIDGANLLTSPMDHTVDCMLLPDCIADGYALLENMSTMGEGANYMRSFMFDTRGNTMAVRMLEDSEKKDEYMVMVTGTMTNDDPPMLLVDSIEEVQGGGTNPSPTPEGPAPEIDVEDKLTVGETVGICIAAAFGTVIVLTIIAGIKVAM